jgi:SAM-dependent methyltransferase
MPFFTQSRFPRLWLLMQNMIGGNACKQALATEHYCGQKRVLEIGCSVGNISAAFCAFPDVAYTGIDIDRSAIDLAQRHFHNTPNFRFSLSSLEELSCRGETFDYVLFAGILHHVDDDTGLQLLRSAVKCTDCNGGCLVIYEPEAVRPSDGWFLRAFYTLFEQGTFLRTSSNLQRLVEDGGIALDTVEVRMVSPGIVRCTYIARFNLLAGRPAGKSFQLQKDGS